MHEALFHSFYDDDSLAALKHAALYFDRLVVPDSSFVVAWGEQYKHVRYVQFIPEDAREHLEYLQTHGVVELVNKNDGTAPTPEELHNLIGRELTSSPGYRVYSPLDAQPLFQFLQVRPDAPEALEVANQVSLMVGAVCLRASGGRAMPCVDNPIIFDTVLSGLRGFFELLRENGALTDQETAQAKSYYLMSRLFELRLPQVAFRNLDDVLEARYVLRNELSSLRGAVHESAAHIPSAPWDPNFAEAVEGHLQRRLLPEIDAVSQKARLSLVRVGMAVGTAAVSLGLQSLLPERLGGLLIGASSVSLVEALRSERQRASTAASAAPFGALLRIRKVL